MEYFPVCPLLLAATPILMWGCSGGWLGYFHTLPVSLKALGFLRLCRGTAWRRSTFSTKGGKNEDEQYVHLFQASWHPPTPHLPILPELAPLLHTYVIWRIADWHYPVQPGAAILACVYNMHVRLLLSTCLHRSSGDPICPQCIFLFASQYAYILKKMPKCNSLDLKFGFAFPLLVINITKKIFF